MEAEPFWNSQDQFDGHDDESLVSASETITESLARSTGSRGKICSSKLTAKFFINFFNCEILAEF